MSSVTVSIIVPCYNAAEFLADALQSVADQTLRELECIIIDDCSTDESVPIARKFADTDPRFRLITSGERQGVSAARNLGISEANGTWIAMLDADDMFVLTRLELLSAMGDAEQADLVFDDQLITEFPSTSSARRAFGFTKVRFDFSQEDFFSGSRLFRTSFPAGYMKPLMSRDLLLRTGAAYDPSVASGEDFLFYAHLFAARPRCIGTNYAGYIYRRRRGSLSRSEEHLHFHGMLGERVLSELGPQLSPRSHAALLDRARDFDDVAHAMPAMRALRQRDWKRLFLTLIKRPRVALTGARLLQVRAARSLAAFRRPPQ